MDVLCDNGREDMAYKLLFQEGCPSWLYEVKAGATTMWESWGAIAEDGAVSTYSYNHYAFGCVQDWMVRHIGGLQIVEPGYKRFRVKPSFTSGLTSAAVSENTPYGVAAVEWRIVDGAALVRVRCLSTPRRSLNCRAWNPSSSAAAAMTGWFPRARQGRNACQNTIFDEERP